MVAGGWGDHWTMAALRTPSVLYTLLTATALGLVVRRFTRQNATALLAVCLYLAFFCTFRYGRTYLTSAPETFWLGLPLLIWLWGQGRAQVNPSTPDNGQLGVSLGAHLGFGVAIGLGLAYKSFALVLPAAATLWVMQLTRVATLNGHALWHITAKVTFSACVALSIFALWFVLDPDPAAVWQEFVVGENVGKLDHSAGYWHTALLGGGFSIWAQALGYAQNAGLLALVVLGLMVLGLIHGVQRWRGVATSETPAPAVAPVLQRTLLVWLGVWLLVFMLPSQRSARYLIPAMPALAMLLALYWSRIARGWFVPTLLLCASFIAVLARIAWAAHDLGMGTSAQWLSTQGAAALGMALVVAGLLRARWTRYCTVAATLMCFAVFNLATEPLNGTAGHYESAVLAQVRQQRLAVPSSFNGQFERFQFVLPGNRYVPYDGDARARFSAADNAVELQRLLDTHDAVVWLQTRDEPQQPLCAPACRVLGQRWEVKGRHQPGEITLANVWLPQQWLFRREWLLTTHPSPQVTQQPPVQRQP